MLPLLIFGLAALGSVQALWPIPRSLQTGSTFLKLDSSFDITININDPPQDLTDAVNQAKIYLNTDKLRRLVVGRGANDNKAVAKAAILHRLTLSLSGNHAARPIAEESVLPLGTRSEGYTLSVPVDGTSAVLTANSTLGLFRGLTTFGQLWYDLAGTTYSYEAPIIITNDTPAFVRCSLAHFWHSR